MHASFCRYPLVLVSLLSLINSCNRAGVNDTLSPNLKSSESAVSGANSDASAQGAFLLPNGRAHIMPIRFPPKKGEMQLAPSGAHLSYYGGPVLANVNVVPVFWTPAVNATTKTNIAAFFAAITSSNFFQWLSEYSTNFSGGTNQHIGFGSVSPTVTIAPNNTSTSLLDSDIQTEIDQQITAGKLPAPTPNTLYMTYFPSGYSIDLQDTFSCQQFCAYHGTFNRASGTTYYGVMPDLSDAGCNGGCGGAATVFANLTSASSHELVEAVTDADVGIATVIAAPLAWYDATNGEIGDICNAQQSTILDTHGTTYTVQQEWSNAAGACIVSRAVTNTPPPDAQNLKVSAFTTTSLTFTWISGLGSTSGFRIATVAGNTAPASCATGTDVHAATSFVATGLSNATTYSARVCSYDLAGNIAGGVTTSGTTATPPPPPTATLTENNGAGPLSVKVGDVIAFKWTSTGAASAASTQAVDSADACGNTTTPTTWVASSLSGTTNSTIPLCSAGHTYTYTYTVDNGAGQKAQSIVKLTVATVPAPTAALTVNGSANPLSAKVGDALTFVWSSTGGNSASSILAVNSADSCGTSVTGSAWVANTLSGTVKSTVAACQSGHTYTYTYTVNNGAGKTATANVKVTVLAAAPTATLTINGTSGAATIHQGTSLTFAWNSTGATTGSSTIKVNSRDSCGTSTAGAAWVINTLSGRVTLPSLVCMVGHTYTYTYKVKNAAGTTTTAAFNLTVIRH